MEGGEVCVSRDGKVLVTRVAKPVAHRQDRVRIRRTEASRSFSIKTAGRMGFGTRDQNLGVASGQP